MSAAKKDKAIIPCALSEDMPATIEAFARSLRVVSRETTPQAVGCSGAARVLGISPRTR